MFSVGCEICCVSEALHLDGLLGQHLLPQVLQSVNQHDGATVGCSGMRWSHVATSNKWKVLGILLEPAHIGSLAIAKLIAGCSWMQLDGGT